MVSPGGGESGAACEDIEARPKLRCRTHTGTPECHRVELALQAYSVEACSGGGLHDDARCLLDAQRLREGPRNFQTQRGMSKQIDLNRRHVLLTVRVVVGTSKQIDLNRAPAHGVLAGWSPGTPRHRDARTPGSGGKLDDDALPDAQRLRHEDARAHRLNGRLVRHEPQAHDELHELGGLEHGRGDWAEN